MYDLLETEKTDLFSVHLSNRQMAAGSARHDTIGILNGQMDQLLVPQGITEKDIYALLSVLENIGEPDVGRYWLMIARLAEMGLLCAGHYADNGVFDCAGDLLFNPKRIILYQKGHREPTIKPRHARISDTLGLAETPASVRCQHLLHNTVVRVERGPLIPELVEKMRLSGKVADRYLARLQQRMKQVADTIRFISAGNLLNPDDLQKIFHASPDSSYKFVLDQLCCFEGNVFRQLGDEIRCLQQDPRYRSPFLAAQQAASADPARQPAEYGTIV